MAAPLDGIQLPPGFVLDNQPPAASDTSGLPPGFVLDGPSKTTPAPTPKPIPAQQPQDPGVGGYVRELGKGVGRGAAGMAGSVLEGLSIWTSDLPEGVRRVEEGLGRLEQMSPEEATAFVTSIPQTGNINPIAAFNYQRGARALYEKGDKALAKQFFDQARRYLDTRPLDEQGPFKAAEELRKKANEALPVEPGFEGGMTSQVGEGAGSFLPLIGLGPLATVAGSSAMTAEQYRMAKEDIARPGRREDRAGLYNAGLGTDAERVARQAAKLGAIPGATEALPVETLFELASRRVPGLRALQGTGAWNKAVKAIQRVGVQAAVEGGQEYAQQVIQNAINQIMIDPEQEWTEGALENAVIGAIVGAGVQTGSEVVTAPFDKGDPPPGPGTPPPAASTPPPAAPVEPQLFPDAPPQAAAPTSEQPAEVRQSGPVPSGPTNSDINLDQPGENSPIPGVPADHVDILRQTDYTDQMIADMNPPERQAAVEEAIQQGITPRAPMQAPTPAPGTAPMAPRRRPEQQVEIAQPEANSNLLSDADVGIEPAPPPEGFVPDRPALTVPPRQLPPREAPLAPIPPDLTGKMKEYVNNSRRPLNEQAVARNLGVDEQMAGRLLQQVVMGGGARQTRSGRYARKPTYQSPPSLARFVADAGGIVDTGGELKAADLHRAKGAMRGIVRPDGHSINDMMEMALEEGFLQDAGWGTNQQRQMSDADFVQALVDDYNAPPERKIYRLSDQAWAEEQTVKRQNAAMDPEWQPSDPVAGQYGQDAVAALDALMAEHGLDPNRWTPAERMEAARLISEGMSPDDALERVVLEGDGRDTEAMQSLWPEIDAMWNAREKDAIEYFDPPFPAPVEDFPDAAFSEAAPQEVADAQEPSEESVEPGSEEDVGRPGVSVPEPRQDRPEPEAQPAVEPGAEGRPQTILPGAEAVSESDAKKSDKLRKAQAEMEAQKKQSKLRRGGQKGVDEQPGGMFEEKPASLFGDEKPKAPDPAPEPAAPAPIAINSMTDLDALRKRFREGDMTAAEAMQAFEAALSAQEMFRSVLGAMSKDELLKRIRFARSSDKKKTLVDSYVRSIVGSFNASGAVQYNPMEEDGYEKGLRRTMEKQTDQQIKDAAEKRKKDAEEFKQRYTDPQTVLQFRDFISVRGMDKLTPEQKVRYDELVAEETKAQREREGQKAATIAKVETGAAELSDIITTKHSQKGHDLFVVKLTERVERDVYDRLNTAAKKLGGYYSAYAKSGAVPGFQFTTREAAEKFQAITKENVSVADVVQERKEAVKDNAVDRLRGMAEKMEESANEELGRERLANTARRANMVANAEAAAEARKALASTMKNLADAIEDGSAKHLDGIRTRVDVETLEGLLRQAKHRWVQEQDKAGKGKGLKLSEMPVSVEMIEAAPYPYPYGHRENVADIARHVANKPGFKRDAVALLKMVDDATRRDQWSVIADNLQTQETLYAVAKEAAKDPRLKYTAQSIMESFDVLGRVQRMGLSNPATLRAALREFMQYRKGASGADPIKKMERELIGAKIDGYFPTPARIVDQMIELAGIEPGMTVAEPSAGKGNIADKIREAASEAALSVIEPVTRLRNILTAKGHNIVDSDFMGHEGQYDRIVMNPPFENGQDIDHVRHAYSLLKPGGRVVAIMSEGPFFRSDRKATEFRDWLDSLSGTSEKLPDGSFKDSERSTGVATRLVVIDKDSSARKQAPLASTSKPQPIFYSALLRAVEGMKQPKAPKAQWMGMIRNAPGVKPDEIAWLGLEDWLAQQSGVITKEQIAEFIRANQVQVQEVVKGSGMSNKDIGAEVDRRVEEEFEAEVAQELRDMEDTGDASPSYDVEQRENDDGETYWAVLENLDEEVDSFDTEEEAQTEAERLQQQAWDEAGREMRRAAEDRVNRAEIERRIQREVEDEFEEGRGTKFSQYTLPGGSNYRELLLTLPEKPVDDAAEMETGNQLADFNRRMREKYGERWMSRLTLAEQDESSRLEVANIEAANARQRRSDSAKYKSGHWDEPNILAHIRFNERTDAEGKRVLFIEEIQSDWHQAGRKKGYRSKPTTYNPDNLTIDDLRPNLVPNREGRPLRWSVSDGRGDLADVALFRSEQDAINYINEYYATEAKQSGVPDAPFKTTWPELALKRAIRWAAENGFDSVSWTPGDVQAERYDLSKQISRIDYERTNEGKYEVMAYDLNSKQVLHEDEIGIDRVEELLGKEIAKKIEDDVGEKSGGPYREWRQLTGLDLKVGGEGMKAFYDSILVKTANALGKKFGARVGQTSIGKGKTYIATPSGFSPNDWMVLNTETKTQADGGLSQAEAEQKADELNRAKFGVWSLPITPDMRQAVMQGQPLFKIAPNKFQAAASQRQVRQLRLELNQVAERILGHRLNNVLLVDDPATEQRLLSEGRDAIFDPDTGLIALALRGSQDVKSTLRHEAIHALRNAGVLTKQEWAALSRLAERQWIDQYDIRSRYESMYGENLDITPEQLQELLVEEAIADAMADNWESVQDPDSIIGRITQKIRRFIEALRSMLEGKGFKSAEQVLADIEAGRMADREPGSGEGRGFKLYAKQASQQAPLASRSLTPPRNPAPGSFEAPHDERVFQALRDSTDTILGRLGRAGKAFGIEARRKLQDREVDIMRTERAIKASGVNIPESQQVYLAASLYPGRTAQRDQDLMKDVIEPLIKDIAARKLTIEQVDDFLRARHAEERNKVIGSRYEPGEQFHEAMTNPDIVGGSGLSLNQANDIIQGFRTAGQYADIEAVADKVLDLNKKTLKKLFDEGLIEQSTYDALTTQYQFYVPLRGYDEAIDTSHPDSPRTGKRYDVRGKEFKEATGRTSKSDSPLAYSIMQARQAIVRTEKNRVGKRLLKLAQANPNEAFWQVNRKDLKKVIDKSTGMVRNAYDPGTTEAENVFSVKIGGKTYHVTLHHEGLLRAMKGLGGEGMHDSVAALHKVMRYFAAINTSYSPEFIVTNFFRDVQQTGIVLQEEQIKGLARKVIKSLPEASAGVFRMLGGNLSTPWAKMAREYADAGGKIGFTDRFDIEEEKANLASLMADENPTNKRKAMLVLRKGLRSIERLNDTVENTMRLATYAALRDSGQSVEKAAFAARELTVNFNRKGEWSPYINSLYLFFNAATQGATNMAMRLGRSKRLQKIVGGIVVGAFLQDVLNRMIAGDDDDDENRYDKIPNNIKSRFGIIMLPKWMEDQYGIPYLKWPLPLGYNMFHITGTQVGHAMFGARGPLEAAGEIVGALTDAFNPLGAASSFSNLIAPTIADPFVDLDKNENWFGEKIMPEPFDRTTPDAEKYFQNVGVPAKTLTDTLSSLTGGSPERPGAIDISPESVEHLFEFATGGIGRLVNNTLSTIQSVTGDTDLTANKIPFVRSFLGQDSKYDDRDAYYEIRDAVHVTEKEFEARMKEGDKTAALRVRKEHSREFRMIEVMNSAEKKMAKLRKEMKAVKKMQGMSDAVRKARVDSLQKAMDETMLSVRKRWNSLGN
jgi:hypothetical protein